MFQVFAATAYDGSAKELIHRLKFGRAQAAALDIARVMTRRIPRGVDWLVVHVPTASTRIRARGYDQAQRIAREVARQLGVPYLPMLVREGAQRQLGQSRKTRQQQMRSAFRVIHRASLQGKHVLLIDDVLTTGATCEAAATVLKDAGAARVSAAVFAAA
ncbi:MAG TPA: phosphoribosyltransferase family protein [Candidatus Saccharimonadales bacterium]|nr:phosphoribosyltransferase family protein [Candidatus Saccharimonadales bacterium]